MLTQFYYSSHNKDELLTKTSTSTFQGHMAYLVDNFEFLNMLNQKLQGRRSSSIHHADSINAFVAKLELCERLIQDGSATQFH